MSTIDPRLVRQLADAIVASRQDKTRKILAQLASDKELRGADLAAEVQHAAEQCLKRQFWAVVGLALLALVVAGIVVVAAIWSIAGVPTLPLGTTPTAALTATPTVVSPPTKASWTLGGHVYQYGTRNGLAGARISMEVFSVGAWQEASFGTSAQDGAFSVAYEPSAVSAPETKIRLKVELPAGWNHIVDVSGAGWGWSPPNIITGSLGSAGESHTVSFQAAIWRTFTGALYFEGESAPASATVELCDQNKSGSWSDPVDAKVVSRPSDNLALAVPAAFTLTHIGILPDVSYRISIAPPPGGGAQDWVASAPPNVGRIDRSAVELTQGQETDVKGIVFAGPLPITLSYKIAAFDPPYSPDKPGPWRDEIVSAEVTYPFATRDKPDVPRGMMAYWPVYLPGGSGYEVWVAIPGPRSSAVVSYALHKDQGGQPGLQVSGVMTPVAQCRNDTKGDEWVWAATYPPDKIGAGGLFWLVVDERQARWPEGCLDSKNVPYRFRMPVWHVEIRRKQ